MADTKTETKPWYKSKTIISGLVLLAVGTYQVATGDMQLGLKVIDMLSGFGIIYGLRTADTTIE